MSVRLVMVTYSYLLRVVIREVERGEAELECPVQTNNLIVYWWVPTNKYYHTGIGESFKTLWLLL